MRVATYAGKSRQGNRLAQSIRAARPAGAAVSDDSKKIDRKP